MGQISNFTYDETFIGQTASYSRHIGEREIMLFAAASGDRNPLHLSAEFAAGTVFGERIAHGMLCASLVSSAVARTLPGPGSIYVSQSLRFLRPVKIGDELTARLEVTGKRDDKRFVTLDCQIVNQQGHALLSAGGQPIVLSPNDSEINVARDGT
ncbi:MAG: MaoC/PaaZ C-terminal domain-containing protein, partial [Xanthomonadales bacterium]|nr:MaoC/PaaZ C-terminal domain-containing protein [Xanthomonadales bacterium]